MPTYDYYCPKCDYNFELFQSIKSDQIANCPKCQTSAERKISLPALVFKGSGFYITDYKKSDDSKKSNDTKINNDTKTSNENKTSSDNKENSTPAIVNPDKSKPENKKTEPVKKD